MKIRKKIPAFEKSCFEKNLILYQIFNFRVTKSCQSLKKIKNPILPIAELENFTKETVLSWVIKLINDNKNFRKLNFHRNQNWHF
jgi:hypothetical protein